MKTIATLVLTLVVGLPALAAGSKHLDEKYLFTNLEEVQRFSHFSIDSWSPVDQQSLIVRTSPSTAYLLVLSHKLHDLRFSDAIALSSTGSSVYAKFDSVSVRRHHFGSIPVRIARIYKLKGREQRQFVTQRIRGEDRV